MSLWNNFLLCVVTAMSCLSASVSLDVVPLVGLIDEKLSIFVTNLEPNQQITFHAKTSSLNGKEWSSSLRYSADSSGKLFLCSDEPMELISAMEPVDGSQESFNIPEEGMLIQILLKAEGKTVAKTEVHRLKIRNDVKTRVISDSGIVALLFTPVSHSPLPAIITLNGGAGTSEARAQLLASHGYVTLALAYFGSQGTPAELENIPLEYFEKAIDWLKKQPEVDPSRIGILGTSRGGEAALLLGSLYPDKIQAIATHVASSVIYRSQGATQNPWTFQGKPILPLAPMIADNELDPTMGKGPENGIQLSPYFIESMKKFPDQYAASFIPVEKIKCPLLMIGANGDQMWPSGLFAEQIKERLAQVHSSKIIIYENAGHKLPLPYTPVTKTVAFHPEIGKWFDFGGKPKDNALAGKSAWEETLSFFKETLQ